MRSRIIGRGALIGYRAGIVGAAALWLAVAVFVAAAGRNDTGFLVVGALALGPALVLVATAVGTVLAALVAPFAPVLSRTGGPRKLLLVAFALVAFCCWGYVADVLPSRYLMFLPLDSTVFNTATLVLTAVGALGGTVTSLTAVLRPVHRPTGATVRRIALTTVLGGAAGLLGWWLRRGNDPWFSGLPSSGTFVGAGFGRVPLDQDWVWGVTTGALLGLMVATVATWIRRPVLLVPLAAVAAGGAAFVSAVTGVMFPVIELTAPITEFPTSGGFASSVTALPPAGIAVTVAIWAVAGALLGAAVLACDRLLQRTRA
ncbi:hypothetical protein [Curtobacterium sp. ZW137]|uniref:hypothetical protein n=1 Tax=Curtobacterium sp. ZW137 TaxID=2485104 RepID=UPI000F4CEF35|nr:hypothetical protein [Curtobacterium sp. ZW137]ROP66033.1 hypothetical protein EDF55_0479 [Curtobacterium sp. ZW137]